MLNSAKFWVSMTVFQLVYGLVVFAVTREYYLGAYRVSASPAALGVPLAAWPELGSQSSLAPLGSPPANLPASDDPAEMSRQADEYFANHQYDRAAEQYQRLLEVDPANVGIHNNLGLTLHYLGRSTEALERLNHAVALDPTHQRSWLTLGFVNSQLGNVEAARTALAKASELGPDEEVRQAALQMLQSLPQ
jgi:tetratricopeptide (TPR) repeat protein